MPISSDSSTLPPQQRQPFIAGQSVFVAGGGIGGLAFAIALSKQWPATFSKPKIIVFERDSYDDQLGREGYTLSLRTDRRSGGIQVLDLLGLYEKAVNSSVDSDGSGAGSMFIWDKDWNELLQVRSKPVGEKSLRSMRVRRNALRGILADAAVEHAVEIRWQTEIIDAKTSEDGKVAITLADGTNTSCTVLIAADGSRSKLRTQLRPNDKLDFAGVVCISGIARFEDAELLPKPLHGNWGLLLGGQGNGLFVAAVDRGSALWSLSYSAKEPRDQLRYPLSEVKTQALLGEARSLGRRFAPRVNDLVNATDTSTLMLFNATDRPPFSHSPARDGAVVWIGDANHAVSPFAGNGANMALMDGYNLAVCLCQAVSLEGALAEYDRMSVPRAQATLNMSRWSIDIAHSTGLKLWLYLMVMKVLSLFLGKESTIT